MALNKILNWKHISRLSKSKIWWVIAFSAVVSNQGAIYNTEGCSEKGVFQYIIKNAFSKCQILKQIAMGSPLGAANFIFSCRVPQA